jgi:hypothetical protein
MKRTKRFTWRRVALGLAVAAILVPAAQAKPTPAKPPPRPEIPYLSHGVLKQPTSPDDRSFSKATSVGASSVGATDEGFGVDAGTVGAAGLALLLAAGGAGLAIRHSRRTRLSPA